ncbi:hypothetical protein [Thiolapillus sp.]
MIRLLLGLLIAGNVVLFLWIQYGDSRRDNERQQQVRQPDFGEIRLLREIDSPEPPMGEQPALAADEEREVPVLEQQSSYLPEQVLVESESKVEAEAEAAVEAEAESEVAIIYCGELGPIRSRNMAEGYRRILSQNEAANVQVEARAGRETTGYWAMIPALPDAASAEAMLKRLQAAGLEDLWLIRNGELENAISLGLYTEERYAKRHADNVRNMGFEPIVMPKQRKTRVYWVVFSAVEEEVLKAFENEKLPVNAVLRQKDCKQALTGN